MKNSNNVFSHIILYFLLSLRLVSSGGSLTSEMLSIKRQETPPPQQRGAPSPSGAFLTCRLSQCPGNEEELALPQADQFPISVPPSAREGSSLRDGWGCQRGPHDSQLSPELFHNSGREVAQMWSDVSMLAWSQGYNVLSREGIVVQVGEGGRRGA